MTLTFENDFRHMGTAAVLDEAHSGRPILGHFFEHCWPYFTNNTNNAGLQGVNCCWFISINQWLHVAPQEIIERCQIARPWRPIDRSISRNQLIAKFWFQYVDGCGRSKARSAILLKPHLLRINVIHIFKQKIIDHGAVTNCIDRNASSGLIFEEIRPDDATSV